MRPLSTNPKEKLRPGMAAKRIRSAATPWNAAVRQRPLPWKLPETHLSTAGAAGYCRGGRYKMLCRGSEPNDVSQKRQGERQPKIHPDFLKINNDLRSSP